MLNRHIRFPNLSNFERTEVAYATVDFAAGEWNGSTPLVLEDDTGNQIDSVIEPFGKRWNDGTVRYARALARLTMTPQSVTMLKVVEGQLSNPDRFRFNHNVLAGSGPKSPGLGIKVDGQWIWTQFNHHLTVLENNRLRRVLRSRHRVGDFVVDMKYYIMSRQQLIRFELSITGSNPSNTLYEYPFEEIRLTAGGNKNLMNIRGRNKRGVQDVIPYRDFRLMSNDTFGDGQKQVWYGEIMPAVNLQDMTQVSNGLAAVHAPLYGVTQEVEHPGQVWNYIFGQYNSMTSFMNDAGDPWDEYPKGVTKTPGQTGAQRDFGCIEGSEVLHAGAAELLDGYLFMATEDTKRPGHYYEVDASPVRVANHPDWITWSGRTHYHFGVSFDRLGKNLPQSSHVHHDWFGKDWQHHSSNLLTLAALLTGSYMLQDEVDVEMELYLAGMTLPSQFPGWSTSGLRAPRGFGRTTHAICNHYLLTAREEVKTHMINRFHEVCNVQWDGANLAPVRNWDHVLDPRVLNGQNVGWVPWNETLGFVGIVALYNVTQDPVVRDLMIAWGQTIVNYGWRATRSGNTLVNAELGGGVKWNANGSPLTPAQYLEPALFQFAGGGLQLWGTPAIKVIAEHPEVFGEQTSELASEYLAFQRSNYLPSSAPFAEYGRWEALDIM